MTAEIEDVLARYRPAGPPPGLRHRILTPRRRTWPWAAAAALLLLAASAVSSSADALAERAGDDVGTSEARGVSTLPAEDEAAEWAALIARYERFLREERGDARESDVGVRP